MSSTWQNNSKFIGIQLSLVEYLLWEQGAVGSNPSIPIIIYYFIILFEDNSQLIYLNEVNVNDIEEVYNYEINALSENDLALDYQGDLNEKLMLFEKQ